MAAHLDPQRFDLFFEQLFLPFFVDENTLDDFRQVNDGAIVQNRHVLEDGVFLPVPRQVGDPAFKRLMSVFHADLFAVQVNFAAVMTAHRPENCQKQFTASVSEQAGHPEDFAFMHAQGYITEVLSVAEVFQPQHFFAVRSGHPLHFRGDLMTDHISRQPAGIGLRHLPRGDHIAVPQHRKAVANLHHFIELVGNEDDPHTLLLQVPHHGKNSFDLRFRERCGRFVHDDHGCFLEQRPADLNDLFVRGIQVTDHRGGVKMDVHPGEEFLRFPDHLRFVEKSALFGKMGDEHVFIDRQIIDQVQFLVDKADPGIQ